MKLWKIASFASGSGLVGLGFGAGFLYAGRRDEIRSRKILKYGLPDQANQLIPYEGYLVCYDRSKKIPLWVAERLNSKKLEGPADRKHINFTVDTRISPDYASANEDYFNSGWSRGHMAASGNYKSSQKEMKDTFFLSNIVPQDIQNNGGYWNLMEIYVRDLTKKFEDIVVYSGPLFLPSKTEGSEKEFVQYQVIGKDKVAVPTHLYKLIVAKNSGQEPSLGAFVVPNQSIPFDDPLQKYEVTFDSLKQTVGVDFLPMLNKKTAQNLCTVEGCKLMDAREFTIFYLSRRLSGSRTVKYLEKDYAEAKEKGLAEESRIKSIYENKLKELQGVQKTRTEKGAWQEKQLTKI